MLLQASAYYFAALRQALPFLFLDYQQLIKNRISGLSEHVSASVISAALSMLNAFPQL